MEKNQNFIVWKKKRPNNGYGFCPNVTLEDDDFKQDNKALNDQVEGEGTNSFLSSLNSLSPNSSGSVLTFSISQVIDLST